MESQKSSLRTSVGRRDKSPAFRIHSKKFMIRTLFRLFVQVTFFTSLLGLARAGAIIESDTGDGMVTQTAVNDGYYHTQDNLNVGRLYRTDIGTQVDAFPLPYLAPGQQVTAATISYFLEQINGSPAFNAQLYGLNRISTTSPAPLVSDFYEGLNDTANVLLNPTFVTPGTTANQAVTYSGANLVSFVQQQYTNAAFSGLDLSNNRYIFFRLSPDGTTANYVNYQFGSARNSVRTYHPMLSLTISNGISNIAGRLQFSFTLPQASVTSAGVYNASTGALLRTLWNNVQYQAGTNYGVWDGNDDSGNAVPSGSNYQIKLIYHNVQYVWDGTVGNTSAAQSGPNVYRSNGNILDMAIAGGNAYYAVGYNELSNPFHSFAVGSPQVSNQLVSGFSDCYSVMNIVAADATRSYWAKCTGGISPSDTYVVAIVNSTGKFYAFPSGTTPTGSNQNYTSCVDFDATAKQANPPTGLAVQQAGNDLFVSHANLNVVRVFDKVQGTSLGSFSVPSPGPLATTANGDVWVVSNTTPPVLQRYTFASGHATLVQTITGLTQPEGVGVSADDSLVLVTDGGTSQQIKAFNNSTGASAWTYGQAGGMAANGPNVNSNTFDFSAGSFVAFQADNSFWVGDQGNQRNLHFGISNNAPSYIEQIAYIPLSYDATVDLTDATRVFSTFLEHSVNYALPLGGTNGSWTLVKNWAYGLPNDSTHNYTGFRDGIYNVVTLSNGHTFGLLPNYATGKTDLIELPASGPARVTGYAFDNTPRIYDDGSLRFNILTSTSLSFYSQPLTGFDASNNPTWGSPALIATTKLGTNDPQSWATFPERTEVTAGGMVIDYDPSQARSGYHLGAIPTGGTSWLWRSAPSTSSSYSGWFPQDGHFDIGNGVQYAGNEAMALGRNILCGYHGEYWKNGEASQWLHFFDNGLMVGRFGSYGNGGIAAATTVNGFAGNSFSPTLIKAANGNTYLYANDESDHGGTIRWRINGLDGITEIMATATLGTTASLNPGATGPSVTITSPTAGASYYNGNTIPLSAQAQSSGASIVSVQFFDGPTSLGTVSAAPFNLTTLPLSTGSHVITATATDSNGSSATSPSVAITIGTDGVNTPPPAPILSSGTVGSQSVLLNWTQPTSTTTSSSTGQIISFQCDSATDSKAMTPSMVAGAPGYAVANFNVLGQGSTSGLIYSNPVNSSGVTIPNLGLNCQMSYQSASGSLQSLTGTELNIFGGEVKSTFNTAIGMTISNIPYANYDLVVYSLPGGLLSALQTASLTVSDNANSSTVQQSFTMLPTGYSVSSVPFGTSTSVTDANTIVFHGLTSSSFKLVGGNIAAFQIVQRPYDQGTPVFYSVQSSPGQYGPFAPIGTVSGTTLSFTDTSATSPGTVYYYRIDAVDAVGSTYSNTVAVTTPASITSTLTTNYSSWQAQYFTAAQLADPTFSGPNADPYGTQVPNLLAYALQLNPATANLSNVPQATIVNGHLTLTYFAPASITDVSYVVEVSTDLLNWNSGAGYTVVTSNVPSSSGNTITVQENLPATANKHFMRLRVTQLPALTP